MQQHHSFRRARLCFRRAGAAISIVLAGVTLAGAACAQDSNAMTPIPIPAQAPAKDGMATTPETRLWYWDTGGPGAPVVLMHPVTGSGLIWGYQQPVFVKAGYRVIAYSRRGYIKSDPLNPKNPGFGSEDLRHLADHLKLDRFHLVASAAGGAISSDFAFSYQQRLLSLTISSSSWAVRDGEVARAAASIRPKIWEEIPIEFRELGPSYRAANPEGVKAWMALEQKARPGPYRQPLKNRIAQGDLKKLVLPTLVITGAADTTVPPSIARMIAGGLPNGRLVIASESGHSPYWEQPAFFNRTILDFLGGLPK